MDVNAPSDGGVQGLLDVVAIEAGDDHLDALPGLLDRRDQRGNSVSWLNQELHAAYFVPITTGSRHAVATRAPAVERPPLRRDGFEKHPVPRELHDHEMVI